ncbi:MAG TPA: TonB-dependent receptor [Rhizomicrobium sp.]|nr:TonB-dependent receptor [Rhizomicrobium sp.]
MFKSFLKKGPKSALMAGAASAALFAIPAFAQPRSVETVVVTASPLANHGDELASISSRLDAMDILRAGGSSLGDALAGIPGVSSSGFAPGVGRPIIRGMDASRVRLLENGTSSADASDIGPDHGVPLDPLSARSIEVVRGAATLRYGSQAIGGVVNAINNRVPTSLADAPGGEVSGGYDSVSDAGQVAMLGDASAGNFAFHADGFFRKAGDYDTPLGPQANSFARSSGASLGTSYFFGDDSRIGGAVVQYDSRYGIPGEDSYINMRQTKYLLGSSLALGGDVFKTLNVDGSYGNYAHHENDPDGNVLATFKNRELDVRAETLLGAIGPFLSSAVGVQVQNRAFEALGEGADYLLPTLTQNYAGFLFTEARLSDTVHLEVSGRVEYAKVQGTPVSDIYTSRDFVPVSGAVGLLWDATEHVKLGVTGSSTARAPAQTELYARGVHEASATYETGDPTLGIERAHSAETSLRLRYDDFTFDGSAYYTVFDNYIYGALTGATCDEDGNCLPGPGEELREVNYTQGAAHFRGLEGKASYALWRDGMGGTLKLNALGDLVRATLSGGANVPRIPAWRFGGGFSWESDPVDAGFQVMRIGDQNDPGPFDTPTPGYVSVDAQITWRPFADRAWEFSLIGQNLADEVVRNAASFNKDNVVMPGRNIRLVARLATN